MQKICLLIISALILINSACKKQDKVVPALRVNFEVNQIDTGMYRIGTGDSVRLTNTSTSGTAVKWDLGNGRTSTENSVWISFDKSGKYKVKLTVTDKNGMAAAVSKTVIVQDRILKTITINKVYWNSMPNQIDHFNYIWPETLTADLFVRIQAYMPGENIKNGLLTNSEVLYDSPLLSGISNNSSVPLNITVSNPVLMNKNMIDSRSLVLSLIAKDHDGKLYDIMSSMDSGCSWGFLSDNIASGQSIIQCQLLSSIQLYTTFH